MLGISDKFGTQERIVTVLDVGTAKIACMVVALAPWAGRDHGIGRPLAARLLGVAHQRSSGIKAGVVVDLDKAEQAIRAAVARAERMAGLTIDEVIVTVSCGRPKSLNFSAKTRLRRGRVGEDDLVRLFNAGLGYAEQNGRIALQLAALSYGINGVKGIRAPAGMIGEELHADLHAVTVDAAALNNLIALVERSYLSVAGLVAAPYASGLATVTEEEARLGVTCIDIGAGTTSISVFAEGQFVFSDAVAIGGGHLSYDIARALSTPLNEAERIKTLYGTLVAAGSSEYEPVPYPVIGRDNVEMHQTTQAKLRQVIRPRIEEILTLVAERLAASGCERLAGERVVLTGGASQLTGLGAFAAHFLGKAVRIGRPSPFGAAPDNVTGPAFASLIGLVHATLLPNQSFVGSALGKADTAGMGYLGRMGHWFKESFWEDKEELATGA